MRVIVPLSFLILVACGGEEAADNDLVEDVVEIVEAENLVEEVEEQLEFTPEQLSAEATLLRTGFYHGDEVSDEAADMVWWGVFKDDLGRILVEKTDLTITPAYDAILDQDGEMTGKEVGCTTPYSTMLLISGLDYLSVHTCKEMAIENGRLDPGVELNFAENGWDYRLYSEADIEEQEYYTEVLNYKLILERSNSKGSSKQVIATTEFFDDAMMRLLFVADIDGDGLLDFFVDTSHKYSYSQPTLFLSLPAEGENLLKEVASGMAVGC